MSADRPAADKNHPLYGPILNALTEVSRHYEPRISFIARSDAAIAAIREIEHRLAIGIAFDNGRKAGRAEALDIADDAATALKSTLSEAER